MTEETPRPRLYAVAWAFYLLLALAGCVWTGWRGDLSWRLFVDPARWAQDLAAGVATAALLIALWAQARRWLPAARRVEDYIGGVLGDVERDEIFALAVISSIAEELFFRGGVQGSWGWLAATALFALLHTGPGRHFRLWTLFALIGGGAFGLLTWWSGNLLAAIVAHGVVNGWNLRYVSRRVAADSGDGNREIEP